ncbi:HNH endonuclease [Romboutsia ilealis]|uniref:HNH endonuclease n=1 Tax=Romboutsia ilealis TaxID=1115758 RepID=UPI00272AC4AE|nr:HNH endonuclease [Romboutsia ilealis]
MIITISHKDEIYKDINFFNIKPNMYKISNYGNIINRKGNKLKYMTDKDGYYRLELVTIYGPKKFYVHRLVAKAFIDVDDDTLVVNHKDSIRNNNYYDNLEWVTIQENNKHGNKHGFVKYGVTSEHRRLNKVYNARFITILCEDISKGLSNNEILYKYRYDYTSKKRRSLQLLLSDLRNKKSWTWISDMYF